MDCDQCMGIETKFNRKYVAEKYKKYSKHGPKITTLCLLNALQSEDIRGMTLLDIGGGLGDIQHALLKSGASSALNVEGSEAYIEACKAEAARLGHASSIRHLHGDFVKMAAYIPMADIVTLDRVICCYPDMPQLVNLSAQKALRFYGVVYPRDAWWVKLAMQIYYNLRYFLQNNPMRNFVHPTEEVEAIVRESGLNRHFFREMGPWQVVVFAR